MTNKINVKDLDIEKLKQTSLCMLPWVHIHLTPDHLIMPCCISGMENSHDITSTKETSIYEWVNSEPMKQMRLAMLRGEKVKNCTTCYNQEKAMKSFRQDTFTQYEQYLEELLNSTNEDGSIDDFKLRYLDIRFNNLCNMKCRTCNASYSTQWELEDRKAGMYIADKRNEINEDLVYDNIVEQMPNIQRAYFAGGEPLINEKHYMLLEEMIRAGRTDMVLTYNTNLSKLNYKNKDLMDLWKRFKPRIQVYASLDDYGERAEYIRHGTVWDEVIKNYETLFFTPNVCLNITTSVSLFNFNKLTNFFDYFLDLDLFPCDNRNKGAWQLNPVYAPYEFSLHTLPQHLKEDGKQTYKKYCEKLDTLSTRQHNEGQLFQLKNALNDFTNLVDHNNRWDDQKERFRDEVRKIDNRRNENFETVFPELKEMMHD